LPLGPHRLRPQAAGGLALEAGRDPPLERRQGLHPQLAKLVPVERRADPPGDLGERAGERVVVRGSRMPAIRPAPRLERDRVLHEGDALALDRVRDEHLWPLRLEAEVLERLTQLEVAVPVAGLDVPAETSQLLVEVAQAEDL